MNKILTIMDVITTAAGKELKITFFAHASYAFEYEGRYIYNDPVSEFHDYTSLPKADVILVGHEHGDHLDPKAIEALSKPETVVIGNGTVAEKFARAEVLEHGKIREFPFMTVEAVPAYNTSPEQLKFHPAERLHNGYILTFGGTRVYVAGDSEATPEMMALTGIDIAFLHVNQPYTMKEEQAARAIEAIRPKIFYPIHTGQTEHKTDLVKLRKLLEGSGIEVRIRDME